MIREIYVKISRRLAVMTSTWFQGQLFVHKTAKTIEYAPNRQTTSYLNTQRTGKDKSSTSVLLAVFKATIYIFLAVLLFGLITNAASSNDDAANKMLLPHQAAISVHFE